MKNVDYTPFKSVFGFGVYSEWCSVACVQQNVTPKFNTAHFHPAFEVFPLCRYVEGKKEEEEKEGEKKEEEKKKKKKKKKKKEKKKKK